MGVRPFGGRCATCAGLAAEIAAYFGGGGVKISRFEGSGFGFGFGAFLASFLPLSLFPIHASMTQTHALEKPNINDAPVPTDAPCPILPASLAGRVGNHECRTHSGDRSNVASLSPALRHFSHKAGARALIEFCHGVGVSLHRPRRPLPRPVILGAS